MNFLIDMGNTRLKWAITTAGQLITGQPLVNTQINRNELIKLWRSRYRPRRVVISCVSANQSLELVQTVARELWLDVDIILVKAQAQAYGVINAYPQPEKLGVDRWLSLVAVWQQYHRPACIIDCGTAITIDLIDADGRHQGGLISPGLTLMKKSLHQGTDALTFTEKIHPFGPANMTEAAIYSGTLAAAVGLIKYVRSKQPTGMQLILTGGDAELIARQLEMPCIVDPSLVLRGLLCVLEGHA
ncbi:MAG: type III pantothenate kinase [Methylobacter sp.]|nr:type III pantothenate kinase [Methylobacter sp.]MDP2098448.1 type III pantothenate kinase [Methylobacter sp.]MDP2427155.1 type III pantothenate kinase [Methylobacter sp.]MDP3056663.1 type III pantothenate kinase [Methylobacter sp.]MDP3364236.1 type III pantothenate kinase [Methylobacter sp.]